MFVTVSARSARHLFFNVAFHLRAPGWHIFVTYALLIFHFYVTRYLSLFFFVLTGLKTLAFRGLLKAIGPQNPFQDNIPLSPPKKTNNTTILEQIKLTILEQIQAHTALTIYICYLQNP